MFSKETAVMEQPCFYVSAFSGLSRMRLLGGPYCSRQQAELAIEPARRWALEQSGDPNASGYVYSVSTANNGHYRSILGIIVP
jgi:hypothetical protein